MTEDQIIDKTVEIFSNFKKVGYFLISMSEIDNDDNMVNIRVNTNMSKEEIYDMFDSVDFNEIDYFKDE